MEREFLVQRTLRRGSHFDSGFVFVISVFTFAVFHICGRLRSLISSALDAHQLEKRKGAGFPQDPSRYLLSNLPHPLPRHGRLPHTPPHATIANRPTSHLLCQFIGAVFFWGNPSLVAFDVFVDGCQPDQPLLALAVFSTLHLVIMQPQVLLGVTGCLFANSLVLSSFGAVLL